MAFTKLRKLQGPCKPLIGASLILIGITAPVFAGYVPPENTQPPRGRAISAGSRGGCENITNLDLMALAPQQEVGQTLSTQPTLTWFVPDETTYPIQLQIYEHVGNGWVDVVEDHDIGQSQYGVMSYTIPASMGLEVGGFYSWRVVLICNPDRPSSNQVAGAEFEVVSRPVDLGTVEGDRIQQAEQFAEAGLWYDAMALLVGSSLSPAAYRSELLTDLAEFEGGEVGTQLRLIAEVE